MLELKKTHPDYEINPQIEIHSVYKPTKNLNVIQIYSAHIFTLDELIFRNVATNQKSL